MTITETKKSNRAIQRQHITYKSKAEISEALHLTRPYLNQSTYKFLSHFLHTQGTGVTQMRITEICKKAGISTGIYSKVVKPEIESMFSQPLIITTPAPMKYDKKRKKKVKASPFKSLSPLSVIKHLVREKQFEEEHELNEFWGQFELQSDIEGDIEGDIESNRSIPWESKDEMPFQAQQNKSFRENLLEKSLGNNRLYDTPPKKDKIVIKKEIKTFLSKNPFFKALDEIKQYEYARRIQLAFIKTKTDIEDIGAQHAIYEALRLVVMEYEKNRQNVHTDYYGVIYVSFENALYNYRIEQEQEQQEFVFEHPRKRQAQKQDRGFIGDYLDRMEAQGQSESDIFGNMFDDLEEETEKNVRKDITKEVNALKQHPTWLIDIIGDAQEAPQERETALEGKYINQDGKTPYEAISKAGIEDVFEVPF